GRPRPVDSHPSQMSAFDVIQAAAAANLVNKDGERVVWELLPGLNAEKIRDLERELGFTTPQELRDLLLHCSGIEGVAPEIDFTGRTFGRVWKDELFPRKIAFAHDGFGNYWLLDVAREPAETAPVFFVC